MDFPEIVDEKIRLENVLVVKSAEFDLKSITAVIGPQASGKSIAAKCIFYFRNYINELFHLGIGEDFSRPTFNTAKLKELDDIFPGLLDSPNGFQIEWTAGDLSICVSKARDGAKGKIRISDQLASLFRRYRNDFLKVTGSIEEDNFFSRTSLWAYRDASKDRAEFLDSIPNAFFVPASRAFFSVIQAEVFTLLSAQQSLDKIMIEFGRYYSLFRSRYDTERPRRGLRPNVGGGRMSEVLGGDFIRRNKKDIIKTKWGEVLLSSSSSGQQESLPLFLALQNYPSRRKKNDMIIVEEPEAHLYPSAQKLVLEEIVETSVNQRCKFLFTTHSPYILACLNNEITNRGWSTDEISAYHIAEGAGTDIYDKEENLVDLQNLDNVSEQIAAEYFEALSRDG